MSQLAAIDLNLLLALSALLEEKNVTRAARRVGISQSAMSHALRRLRHLLGDPLFVRVGNAMQPTPRAQSLRLPVTAALHQIERVLAPPADFDPGTLDRRFRFLAADHPQLTIFPDLVSRMARLAPRVQLELQDYGSTFQDRLISGEADLALGFVGDLELPGSLEQKVLYTDRHVCLVRADLPGVPRHLDWVTYASLGHVLSMPRGSDYPLTVGIDRALKRRGLERRRCLTVSGGPLIPAVLLRSDYVATVAEGVADYYCRWFPLRKVEPPFRRTEYQVSLVWDLRYADDPAHRWLRSLVVEVGQAPRPAQDPGPPLALGSSPP